MKTKIFVPLLFSLVGVIAACRGDHSANSGKDTAKQHYNAPSSLDTSKVNTPGSDAGLDNSASGGTKIAKDSTQLKTNKK